MTINNLVIFDLDGGIVSFKATHPKWSYAKVNEDGFVSEVAEKKPISDDDTFYSHPYKVVSLVFEK